MKKEENMDYEERTIRNAMKDMPEPLNKITEFLLRRIESLELEIEVLKREERHKCKHFPER